MLAFIDPETLIPADHPLRPSKLRRRCVSNSRTFDQMYAADASRASIPPTALLRPVSDQSVLGFVASGLSAEELTYHLRSVGFWIWI